jgi:hypothetical protein
VIFWKRRSRALSRSRYWRYSSSVVDEQDDVAALGDLLHHLLEALLKLSPVLGPGDQRREIERIDLLALQKLGDVGVRDPLSESFDDGGLADARLADQHGVVLGPSGQDLHDPLDLGLAPHHRVEPALGGQLRQVASELIEQLRRLLALAGAGARTGRRAGALPAAARTGQHADDLVADLLGVGVEVEQDARRDALVLAHQPEQDVLGADVVVPQAERLPQRQLEHLLGTRRERDLAARDLLTGANDPHDLGADALDGDVE